MVRAFPNEIINDDHDHSIPDFWTECTEKNLLGQLKALRPDGKKDLYGLCSPARSNETHFHYGIGVVRDENTDAEGCDALLADGFTMWETEPADYAVFKCFGEDGDCLEETWRNFSKNLHHRQATRRQRTRTMKFILSAVKKGCSANCGCQYARMGRNEKKRRLPEK